MRIIGTLFLYLLLALPVVAQEDNQEKLEAIEAFINDATLNEFVKVNNCNKSAAIFIMNNPHITRETKLERNNTNVMIGNKNDLFYKCTESDYLVFDDVSFNGKKLKVDFSYFVKKELAVTGKGIVKKSGSDWYVKKIKYKHE